MVSFAARRNVTDYGPGADPGEPTECPRSGHAAYDLSALPSRWRITMNGGPPQRRIWLLRSDEMAELETFFAISDIEGGVPDPGLDGRALVIRDGGVRREVEAVTPETLGDGEVLIQVQWSGINYKDALACTPEGKVRQLDPLVPGIDAAGFVRSSTAATSRVGGRVIVHGYGLGVSHHGGFSSWVRVPAEWVVDCPEELSLHETMVLGTAGYTAALSVEAIERAGVDPGDGPVVVTGAAGGVGGLAVRILLARGYEVVASTGRAEVAQRLLELGCSSVEGRFGREWPVRALGKQRWSAAIDSAGGRALAEVLTGMRYGGVVAASGNAAGVKLETTVFPFILRGVQLVGIDSVATPLEERARVWSRLATDLRPVDLEGCVAGTVDLQGVVPAADQLLRGAISGRTLVGPHL
jgi:acrylyl-CoA reductase (NADPH)